MNSMMMDKSGPPKPPMGMKDAPMMSGMDDGSGDDSGDSDAGMMKRIEDKLDKIISALGIGDDESSDMSGDMPMAGGSGGDDSAQ